MFLNVSLWTQLRGNTSLFRRNSVQPVEPQTFLFTRQTWQLYLETRLLDLLWCYNDQGLHSVFPSFTFLTAFNRWWKWNPSVYHFWSSYPKRYMLLKISGLIQRSEGVLVFTYLCPVPCVHGLHPSLQEPRQTHSPQTGLEQNNFSNKTSHLWSIRNETITLTFPAPADPAPPSVGCPTATAGLSVSLLLLYLWRPAFFPGRFLLPHSLPDILLKR